MVCGEPKHSAPLPYGRKENDMYLILIKPDKDSAPIGSVNFTTFEKAEHFRSIWAGEIQKLRKEYADYLVECEASNAQSLDFNDYVMWTLVMACESMSGTVEGACWFKSFNNSALLIED